MSEREKWAGRKERDHALGGFCHGLTLLRQNTQSYTHSKREVIRRSGRENKDSGAKDIWKEEDGSLETPGDLSRDDGTIFTAFLPKDCCWHN